MRGHVASAYPLPAEGTMRARDVGHESICSLTRAWSLTPPTEALSGPALPSLSNVSEQMRPNYTLPIRKLMDNVQSGPPRAR